MPRTGELKVRVNPEGIDADLGARFLAHCFGTRWTPAMYRWYLERPFGGESSDRLAVLDGARVVASCGLAYRQLRTADSVVHQVGVLVAACTAPGERGRGCFARVVRAAVDRSAERGCTAVLGFVTAENASGRVLERSGATRVASAYLVSHARRPAGPGTLRLRVARVTQGWPVRAAGRLDGPPPRAGFLYQDTNSWRAQMLERPHPVRALRVGTTCRALVEQVGDTHRLQWLDGEPRERLAAIRALAAHAHLRCERFFMYSTHPGDVAAAGRLGLIARPGYLMALAAEPRHEPTVRTWAGMCWDVQSGDRM
jgi:hypothetical protein